jgi:predicted nucleic acid-binding protein
MPKRSTSAPSRPCEVISAYGAWVREPTTPATVMRATDLADMAQIGFWDALIVASAEQACACAVYSEDLNVGQMIAGIKIINPLAGTEKSRDEG